MNQTVERVARAIYAVAPAPIRVPLPDGRELTQVLMNPEDVARAAIAAMREPTLAVLTARKALYIAKAERHEARGSALDDDFSRAELSTHSAEAMEWAESEMAALFDAALAEGTEAATTER